MQRGRREYRDDAMGHAAPVAYPTGVDLALQALRPFVEWRRTYVGMHQAAAALLGDRASPWAIKDWRRGRRRAPQWARDMLRAELEKHASAIAKAIAALEKENGPE